MEITLNKNAGKEAKETLEERKGQKYPKKTIKRILKIMSETMRRKMDRNNAK